MPWHPMVVHLPLALLAFALVVDLAALARRRPHWHAYAYVTQLAGTLAAAAAVLTGNRTAAAYRDVAAAAAVQAHEDWATAAFLLFLVVSLGRLPGFLRAPAPDRTLPLWVVLTAVAVAVLAVAGYHGGQLVYELGVGVAGP